MRYMMMLYDEKSYMMKRDELYAIKPV